MNDGMEIDSFGLVYYCDVFFCGMHGGSLSETGSICKRAIESITSG